jgi:hypothetical protein
MYTCCHGNQFQCCFIRHGVWQPIHNPETITCFWLLDQCCSLSRNCFTNTQSNQELIVFEGINYTIQSVVKRRGIAGSLLTCHLCVSQTQSFILTADDGSSEQCWENLNIRETKQKRMEKMTEREPKKYVSFTPVLEWLNKRTAWVGHVACMRNVTAFWVVTV